MNLYIWKRRDRMTANYHEAGGALAIATSLDRARSLIRDSGAYLNDDSEALVSEPDMVYALPPDVPEYAEVFPDAGCC